MSVFLLTTQRGDMRALAGQGIFAVECHAQLHELLLRRLGPRHAALLAEPQHTPTRQSIDWYAEGDGSAQAVATLPEEQAALIRNEAGSLARDIAELASTLAAEGQGNAALSGQLLMLALQHAHEDDLWLVGDQPVVVNWGFAPAAASASPQDLVRLGGAVPVLTPAAPVAASAVPATAAAATGSAGGCLPWLLPLLLLLLLLWLLLAIAGYAPSPLPSGCFRHSEDQSAIDKAAQERAALEEELARLRTRLAEKADLCRPVQPAEKLPPKEDLRAEAPTQEPEVIEPFFGETPVAPEPKPAPTPPQQKAKPDPAPAQKTEPKPRPAPKRGEELKIPNDAAQKKDLSFLEGCWVSETGLYSHPSNEPITAEYCFDKNGKGRRFVRERNGQVCSGSAQAHFQGNRLFFESGVGYCPRGGQYVPQEVQCTGNETQTRCQGKEKARTVRRWDASFRRK